ncbi:MAG: phage tail protein [Clostridium sp.]
MYKVKIINEEKSLIINDVSTASNAPRIEGTIKKGINTIDSFEFTIYPNNQGFNSIYALTTLIEIENTITNKLEFKGRVLLPKENMSSSGLFYKTVTCESEMAYLLDSNQIYGEYHNISVRNFLEKIIENHNKFVSKDKWFSVGNITVKDNNDSLYKYLSYEDKTLDTIKEKLIKVLGGELQIRYENGIRYLDYLEEIGEQKETLIALGRNLESLNRENNPTAIITRLIPLGKKLEDSDQRLTIKEVNNGVVYIDDEEAIKRYGIITGSKTWDDVTEASNLLRKGKEFLESNNKVVRKNSISALDLALIGIDIDTFDVGNTYPILNPVLNISEYLRVVEKTIDINAPHKSSLTIGDKYISMTEIQSNEKKEFQYNRIQIQDAINTINKTIGKVVIELAETKEGLLLKISKDELESELRANADSWGLSFDGKLISTHYKFDSTGFQIGSNASGDTAIHTQSYSMWKHSKDGYTKADADGFYRNGRPYHTLMSIGSAIVGGSAGVYPSTATIQLPDEWKGKTFSVQVQMIDTSGGIEDEVVKRTYLRVTNIDTANATFSVRGYWTAVETATKVENEKELQFSYIAIGG